MPLNASGLKSSSDSNLSEKLPLSYKNNIISEGAVSHHVLYYHAALQCMLATKSVVMLMTIMSNCQYCPVAFKDGPSPLAKGWLDIKCQSEFQCPNKLMEEGFNHGGSMVVSILW